MINTIITDFDGTLVDTFEANFRAYQKAFESVGLRIQESQYRDCFGLRYDAFMKEMGINDSSVADAIKEAKKEVYPAFFESLKPNYPLIELIASFHAFGAKTAIASTARKENLLNALKYLDLLKYFDLIFAGVDVHKGKPDPEIYLKTMSALGVSPENTLIFEDSPVGIEAAKASGAKYIHVTSEWFE